MRHPTAPNLHSQMFTAAPATFTTSRRLQESSLLTITHYPDLDSVSGTSATAILPCPYIHVFLCLFAIFSRRAVRSPPHGFTCHTNGTFAPRRPFFPVTLTTFGENHVFQICTLNGAGPDPWRSPLNSHWRHTNRLFSPATIFPTAYRHTLLSVTMHSHRRRPQTTHNFAKKLI